MRLQAGNRRDGRRAVAVVGGGLAGSEAAWQIARRLEEKVFVDLFEMRPERTTPAHTTHYLAELVCSNSLKSEDTVSPTGMLKRDLLSLESLIIRCAHECRVPAGKALAVDRVEMARAVTSVIQTLGNVAIIRKEITEIPEGYDAVIIATGPLTSNPMAATIKKLAGDDGLYFYDAIAPIVEADSIDMNVAFVADRYGDDDMGDYINLPLSKDEYEKFVDALLAAEAMPFRDFEKKHFFEGCLPIEEIASRGREALSFGPLKPVGLRDPRTGERPYAIVQLRKENAAGDAYNLVGFQTKLTYPEQDRVFRTLPGLANVNFLRYGSLHRNTYVNSPKALNPDLGFQSAPDVKLAGQITGVEGYVESIATGLLAGLFTAWKLSGVSFAPPPPETTLGALLSYITDGSRAENFQPTNINFSLFPALDNSFKGRKTRRAAVLSRAETVMNEWRDKVAPRRES